MFKFNIMSTGKTKVHNEIEKTFKTITSIEKRYSASRKKVIIKIEGEPLDANSFLNSKVSRTSNFEDILLNFVKEQKSYNKDLKERIKILESHIVKIESIPSIKSEMKKGKK